MDLGKKIREIRTKKGIEQLELANKVGISQSKMNKIETGFQKRIEPEILSDIAKALGVTTDYLLGTIDEKESSWDDLTEKDEKDIAKRMEKLKKDLMEGTDSDGLNYLGEPLSKEAIESLLDALEYAERQTTRINKKYTPKKYRKRKS